MIEAKDISIRVKAYDCATGQFVGEYDSISKASRKLFIRYDTTIHKHLYPSVKKNAAHRGGRERGVTSYKDGKKYFFEII